jgi:hypothetical protein
MVTLTLRVEQSPTGPKLMFHHAEIDAGEMGPSLGELAHGTYVQADCEYVAGIGMRATAILAVTAHSQPSPRTSIRALVEKREFARALEELEAIGDTRVLSDPALLIARACARIGSLDEDGAAADLRMLLGVPGITSLDVRDVFERFSTQFGSEATLPLAKEFVTWVEARKPTRALSYLSSIPVGLWPLELLLTGLEEAVAAAPPDPARVRQLLEAARSAAPQDPRVRNLWAQAAAKGLTAGRMSEPA